MLGQPLCKVAPDPCTDAIHKIVHADTAYERAYGPHLKELGLVDGIVPEPRGGAHHDHAAAAEMLKQSIIGSLDELSGQTPAKLLAARYDKFRAMGVFSGA